MAVKRLDRYVAEALGLSRSESRKTILAGRVAVDGAVCRRADLPVDPSARTITADGRPMAHDPFVYIMLNKPAGVVSAAVDGRDVTVVDLVAGEYPRRNLFPAGRLDKDSTGFVLLTDDGAFAHRILAPRRHVPKTYRVTLNKPLDEEMRAGFAAGLALADGTVLAPAEVTALSPEGSTVRVVLHQGVYHQIKRMFGVYGAGVETLHREAIGGLALDENLAPGQSRLLSAEEVRRIAAPVSVKNDPFSNK